jgi:hypothetical protein
VIHFVISFVRAELAEIEKRFLKTGEHKTDFLVEVLGSSILPLQTH